MRMFYISKLVAFGHKNYKQHFYSIIPSYLMYWYEKGYLVIANSSKG